MNNALRFGIVLGVVLALLAGGVSLGYAMAGGFNQARTFPYNGSYALMGDPAMMQGYTDGEPCPYGATGRGYGMMGGQFGGMMGGQGMMGGFVPDASLAPDQGESLTLDEAVEVAEAYAADFGDGFEVREVMQFDNHFYAQIAEEDTGIGAQEILIDPQTGAIFPEPGPNMMWNTRYGHMGGINGNGYSGFGGMGGGRGMMGGQGMMGGFTVADPDAENTVSPGHALELAQAELDRQLPGTEVDEEFDPFYGYYTMHILRDGDVVGMMSVNSFTGQTWIHSWHGTFVEMTEHSHE